MQRVKKEYIISVSLTCLRPSLYSVCLSIEWYLLCVVVVTGLCIYVSIRHGVKANKFIARITSFRRRKRKARKNKS